MKRIVLVFCFAALALGQQPRPADRDDFDVTAMQIRTEGKVLHMSGRVVITAASFTLRATEADFDQDSKEIRARGDVSIKLR